jgi:hypothetical protein
MVKSLTYGRLGNFLYQLATSIGYAEKHGLDFTVNNTTTSPKWNPLYCQHLINPNWNPALPVIHLKERQHEFVEIPFMEEWRQANIILDGYYQSNKYYNHCMDKVVELMNFKWEHKPNLVSVHVRRGDYIELSEKHPYVSKEWMEEALINNLSFLVMILGGVLIIFQTGKIVYFLLTLMKYPIWKKYQDAKAIFVHPVHFLFGHIILIVAKKKKLCFPRNGLLTDGGD